MRKRIHSLRKEGTEMVEMVIDHTLPFDKTIVLKRGGRYKVDHFTASYLIGGFYATKVAVA